MKDQQDIEQLERLIVQLSGLHEEIAQLAKKAPNDALNNFKLKHVNKIVESGNSVLGEEYIPFEDFKQFDKDDVPTNSDVAMILTQYIKQAERYRSDNVIYSDYNWVYLLDGKPSTFSAKQSTQVGS